MKSVGHLSRRFLLALALAGALASLSQAKAPSSKDVMKPVDTSAGSLSDPMHLLQVDLSRTVSVGVSGQPAEVAYNQISAILMIEWGFAQGVDKYAPLTLNMSGRGSEVMKALGVAANVRFEVGGPTQIRVVKARAAAARKRSAPPEYKPPTEP